MSTFGFARSNAFVAATEGGLGRRANAPSRVASCKVNNCSSFSSSSLEVMDLGIPVLCCLSDFFGHRDLLI